MSLLPIASAEELKLDPVPLSRACDLLDAAVGGGQPSMPGAALVVGRGGRMLAPRLFGRQGPEPDAGPLRDDAVFLLASITKPFTYLAALTLVEQGRLDLQAPVAEYVPEFAAHGKTATRVFHLFTHTSGLPDMLPQNVELRRRHAPLADYVGHVCRDTPLLFPSGTDYSYQSMGTLIVAEIVQRLAGLPLAAYLRRLLFDPLGLHSTRLGLDDLDPARIARIDAPSDQAPEWNWNSDYWRRLGAPWGGMLSSPVELAVLCQLMLNGGAFGDVRVVQPATIEWMTSNRFVDLPDLPKAVRKARGWGLGWQLNRPALFDPLCDLSGARMYGHHGPTGTLAWIDPDRNAFFLLLTTEPRDRHAARMLEISSLVSAAIPAD